MNRRWVIVASLCALVMCAMVDTARSVAANEPLPPAEIRAAAERGLKVLDGAAAKYSTHRKCFSCHHQTLPMLAQVMARTRGCGVDEELFRSQLKVMTETYDDDLDKLKQGTGIGGKASTAGYALWAALLANDPPSELTEAMVEYLLLTQRAEGHWTGQTCRPPLEESYLTCTVLAIQGLQNYACDRQRPRVAAAIEKGLNFLLTAPAKGQEDKLGRLWGLSMLGRSPAEVAAGRDIVLKGQREDGGWAQLDEMSSDAYATGQTLYLLHATGYDSKELPYQRGLQFLVKQQRPDGYWLVVTRSKAIQPYFDFDDEDPLGKNQFISVPASSWAVAALLAALDYSQ